ncbi:hypothetical protein [uncultured Pontibacter sp.]|uniref:hypothetical protein n=1 Tax=uncultured Pontibacter sp. TaxID=453356 RepID=UPI00262287FB|nr:hypothetical protein [uncultured Pontibacter sp.]
MAITSDNAKLLFYAKQLGASFTQTLMLGRLCLGAKQDDITKHINLFKNSTKAINDVQFENEYAEPLFEILGATLVDSIDNSGYEGASIIHDMNVPIPLEYQNKYSAVVDGGTLEHIFNFPVAIKNCMDALKVGGHFIGFTPANNTFGHGFYQFSSELFYRVFCSQNGFKIKMLAAYTGDGGDWYTVADTEQVKSRVMLTNALPTHLIVIAEKVEAKAVFYVMPQQTDYQYAWDLFEADKQGTRIERDSKLLFLYKKVLPSKARLLLRKTFDSIFNRHQVIEGIGKVNPKFFKKVDINNPEV